MDDLPPLYAGWMRSLAGTEIPRETVATCAACVMLPGTTGAASATYFNAATKCCTFLPEMHNFLVGGVLDDAENHPAGTASLERRIDEGVEVTPLGLGRSRAFLLLYTDGGDLTFGRSAGLRCPHYLDDGGCGVWKHRESTCATWFCKYNRGKTGHDVWREVHRVLRLAEGALAWWCLGQLGVSTEVVGELLARKHARGARVSAADVDLAGDARARAALWGAWLGRERAFYRACGGLVRALSWSDVIALGGPELALAANVLRAKLAKAGTGELPPRLRIGALTLTSMRDALATITTYNGYDPVTLPVELVDILQVFDDRPTADALAELAARDIELDPALLQRLLDFGVLVPTPG